MVARLLGEARHRGQLGDPRAHRLAAEAGEGREQGAGRGIVGLPRVEALTSLGDVRAQLLEMGDERSHCGGGRAVTNGAPLPAALAHVHAQVCRRILEVRAPCRWWTEGDRTLEWRSPSEMFVRVAVHDA